MRQFPHFLHLQRSAPGPTLHYGSQVVPPSLKMSRIVSLACCGGVKRGGFSHARENLHLLFKINPQHLTSFRTQKESFGKYMLLYNSNFLFKFHLHDWSPGKKGWFIAALFLRSQSHVLLGVRLSCAAAVLSNSVISGPMLPGGPPSILK